MLKFNHEGDTLHEAFGISKERVVELMEHAKKVSVNHQFQSQSKFIEEVFAECKTPMEVLAMALPLDYENLVEMVELKSLEMTKYIPKMINQNPKDN